MWLYFLVHLHFLPFRLLLRILRQQQASFVLQRSDSALCRSDEALTRLSPTEETLQTLTAVRAPDKKLDQIYLK